MNFNRKSKNFPLSKNLKPYHSLGPNNIPASFIKFCKTFITKPLTYIFNLSLSFRHFFSIWKLSFVYPLFISDNKKILWYCKPLNDTTNVWNQSKQIYVLILQAFNVSTTRVSPGKSTALNMLEFTSLISILVRHLIPNITPHVRSNDWLIFWIISYLQGCTQIASLIFLKVFLFCTFKEIINTLIIQNHSVTVL